MHKRKAETKEAKTEQEDDNADDTDVKQRPPKRARRAKKAKGGTVFIAPTGTSIKYIEEVDVTILDNFQVVTTALPYLGDDGNNIVFGLTSDEFKKLPKTEDDVDIEKPDHTELRRGWWRIIAHAEQAADLLQVRLGKDMDDGVGSIEGWAHEAAVKCVRQRSDKTTNFPSLADFENHLVYLYTWTGIDHQPRSP